MVRKYKRKGAPLDIQKLKAAKLKIENGELSQRQVARDFGINESTLRYQLSKVADTPEDPEELDGSNTSASDLGKHGHQVSYIASY